MSKYTKEIESLLLLHTPEMDSRALLRLRKYANNYENAIKVGESGWREAGLTSKQIESIRLNKNKIDAIIALYEKEKVTILPYGELEYPELLAEIADPPAVLYVKGKLPARKTISIVGTRKPTRYGETIAQEIADICALAGLTIVSGLALGIDSVGHKVAVAQHRPTVAVLPCSINRVYPVRHTELAKQILENGGALVSEYPLTMPLYKQNFLIRNRIIAGLSMATIVVEAAEGSGALVTARVANEYNRDVYTVPGDIDRDTSWGPNQLIQRGAIPITTGKDLANSLFQSLEW
jgi:DNA processing protein